MRGTLVRIDQNFAAPEKFSVREYGIQLDQAETLRLVKQAQAGDGEAFAQLVRPYMRKAYYIALKITRNREDAEDVSQQAFLKALAKIGQFRGVSQFSTWLTRIVMNEALMVMRKRRSEDSHITYDFDFTENPTVVERMRAGDNVRPEVLYEKEEEERLLRTAIGNLRDTLRVAVCLLGLEEQKSKDAAKILNLSQAAVKTRFLRARQELRECLTERF
jgi:RNA polymerase sigma-70 factor (ECF subfamily)